MRCFGRIAAIVAVVGMCACGSATKPRECTDDLSWDVSPGDTTIAVGGSFTARIQLLGCRGTEPVADTFVWRSKDTTIAVVDSVSGLVTGVRPGNTYVLAYGKTFSGPYPLGFTVR